jgi:uncharacterized protein
LGIKQNESESAKWISKSAEFGLVPAQLEYGAMLRDGTGVPKDQVQAYKWFLIADERGGAENKTAASVGLRALQTQLTTEQMASAKRQATAWVASRKFAYPGQLR